VQIRQITRANANFTCRLDLVTLQNDFAACRLDKSPVQTQTSRAD